MTQEEKAKAYDEALERARKYMAKGYDVLMPEIFPELRESDDERIRKEAISIVQSYMNICDEEGDPCLSGYKVLAYLEKQKEQKHPDGCFTCDEYKKGYEAGRLNGFTAGYNKAMKEQKPWKVGANAYFTPEQKPAEWSEVELEFRGEKVKVKRPFYRDDKGRGYSTAELDEEVAWNALRAWCEKKDISLYDLYPKAEWSEEDERMLSRCEKSIESSKQFADSDTFKKAKDNEIDWLENRFKSLRPSWKPSEEQMNVLRKLFIEGIKALTQTDYNTLNSIYLDLKKLM